jgi:hypothetical protein
MQHALPLLAETSPGLSLLMADIRTSALAARSVDLVTFSMARIDGDQGVSS